jgi:PEP-CTERM motif
MKAMRVLTHLALATLGLTAIPAFASSLMPDLSLAPAGWSVDRYAPSSFSNLGTVNGQNNVLGIGIDSSGDLANRPSAYQYTFYNTQGENHSISGGSGDSVAVLLYVPELWSNPTNGDVRTDLWVNTANADYGILGFTNFGTNNRVGVAGGTFQYWNDGIGTWTAVSAPVMYGQWNSFDIKYTGSTYDYWVNGVSVGTTSLVTPDSALTQVLLEAYNYNDRTFGATYGNLGVTNNISGAYTAEYANAPEPASFGLIGLGLLGLAAAARRKSRG